MILNVLLLFASLVAVCFCHADPALPLSNKQSVLFVTNSESGQANVHIATAVALIQKFPLVEVHFASFSRIEPILNRVSKNVLLGTNEAIQFHDLKAPSYTDALAARNLGSAEDFLHAPGLIGPGHLVQNLDILAMPWNSSAYEQIYHAVRHAIEAVEPTIIVADMLFMPGIEAALDSKRRIAILSPIGLRDAFGSLKPLKLFTQYPVAGSGYDYPLPLWQVPGNILSVIRLIYRMLSAAHTHLDKAALLKRGFKKPGETVGEYNPDIPFISGSKESIEYPIDVPAGVIQAGPIVIPTSSIQQQDPDLAVWLARRPTILINLGSHFTFSEDDAHETVAALLPYLEQGDVQVLWKLKKRLPIFTDAFLAPVQDFIDSGLLRLEQWISADIGSVLASGSVAVVVHHGGANCFNEALSLGVPQLVLPVWFDTYDNAVRSEWLGVGLWGSRRNAPSINRHDLSPALDRLLGGGKNGEKLGSAPESNKIKAAAKDLARNLTVNHGRDIAAQAIVDLMRGPAGDVHPQPAPARDEL